MIKVENIQVFNLEGAIRGMRFPLQSNNKSDSGMIHRASHQRFTVDDNGGVWISRIPATSEFRVGEKDFDLMKRLVRAGSDHAKWTRQVLVSMDITGPLYWWKEADTYKVGTTTNSESTMHTITRDPFTIGQFSADEELFDLEVTSHWATHGGETGLSVIDVWDDILYSLNHLRERYLATKDKRYWRALIQLLPSSWNQKRHWTGNYTNLLNMGVSRQNHKLSEWREFIDTLKRELPYYEQFLEVLNER